MGRQIPRPRSVRDGRCLLTAADLPAPDTGADRTADHRAAVRPPLGPHRIAHHLHLVPSTVEKVLGRYRMPRLSHLTRPPACPPVGPNPSATNTGIPGLGARGHRETRTLPRRRRAQDDRATRRHPAQDSHRGQPPAQANAYLHHAVDDHSRLACPEILADEKKDTAAGFWQSAREFSEGHGITVVRVLTDNGSCYRSNAFAHALGPEIKHKFTWPYRLQTNWKVEGSTAAWSRNGRTRNRIRAKKPGSLITVPGFITTMITDSIPGSRASHLSIAFITSVRVTPSG